VPAFAPDDKDIDTISTGLYENKMKKSELKRIIREEMGLPQPPVKVAPEKDPKGGRRKVGFVRNEPPTVGQEPDRKINEVMEGGVNYDSDIASELSMIVGDLKKITPYVLELGDTIQSNSTGNIMVYDDKKLVKKFKDIDAFLSGIRYKREKVNEVVVAGEFVKPEIVTAIMAAVPTLVALGAAINWKEEITAWLKGLASKDEKIEDVVMKDK
jgi:hypothetical protein